jgi:alkylated DNA repair dioxygenase AlkB
MIPGLTIISDFITPDEEKLLLEAADSGAWKNRPHGDKQEQIFYSPEYKQGSTGLPDYTIPFSERTGYGEPYRLIVSEYKAGQGMVNHSDVTEKFNIIGATLSLLSESEWVFSRGATKLSIIVPARSLLTFSGDARYLYQHEVRGIGSRRVSFYFSFKEAE